MILEPRLYPYDEINKTFNFGDLITGGVRNNLHKMLGCLLMD
jgi:hypothetical protein